MHTLKQTLCYSHVIGLRQRLSNEYVHILYMCALLTWT